VKLSPGVFALLLGAVPAGQLALAQDVSQIPNQTQEKIGVQLVEQFTYDPFDPPMPDHIYMQTDEDKMSFLHFAKPVTEPDNRLLFIGEGIKGRFCAEDQPEGGETGFVHFHRADPKPAAHGGNAGDEGYWLRHIAVDEFEMMGTRFEPGVAYDFMPTPPPQCG
jgi:hypothetical protein